MNSLWVSLCAVNVRKKKKNINLEGRRLDLIVGAVKARMMNASSPGNVRGGTKPNKKKTATTHVNIALR